MANKNLETLSDSEFDAIFGCLDGDDNTVEQEAPMAVEAPAVEATVEQPVVTDNVEEIQPVTKSVIAGTRHISKPRVVVNKYAGMAPLTAQESDEFNGWLASHGLCKTIGGYASTKRMRVYRNLGTKKNKQIHSRDCIYVVSADAWRKNKEGVKKVILKLSQKQMDAQNVVKVAEYRQQMNQIEEDLLMNHNIVMNWYNGKSATFKKIQHKIVAQDVLEALNEAVKHNDNYDVRNMHLQRFRMGAQIEELGIAPQYDWRNFDVIVKGGKVVCAYSYRDLIPLYSETFKTGFFDKFGYNTGIVNSETVEKVKALGAQHQCYEAETKVV